MRRRQVLAAGAALLGPPFAGCGAHPVGTLDLRAVTDAELAAAASHPADRLPDELAALVRGAIGNESPTETGTHPPLEEGLPVVRDGRYYEVTWTVVAEEVRRNYDVRIDYDPEDATGPAVAFEDLPAVDRETLGSLVPPSTDRRVDGFDVGVGRIYTDAEVEASVLVPTPEYEVVVHDGNRYRVDVGDPREVTVKTYRYDAEEVAGSAEAYARLLVDRYLFVLSGLSPAEREVVEAAIEGSYHAEDTGDDAFRSVAERIRSHPPVEADGARGHWLARYESETYWVDLDFWGFADETG